MAHNPLHLSFTNNHNDLYWAYNCPVQMWVQHEDPDDENSTITGWRAVNYMPRKEACGSLDEEVTPDEMPTYCRNAAVVLRNLADRFEAMANGEINSIYYPDETLDS